ncbi:DNA (cytosine-5-)-methyltransferase [Duncaniella muris]|uniref:DNA (cytosine-5-)-methyltransferase n=1 Tax=Duncaniella muris TaxID=2094150 RepID=UPI0025A5B9BD|nr:DNA (cytosine-5-)-methyltransferase [Duncaniella muris]
MRKNIENLFKFKFPDFPCNNEELSCNYSNENKLAIISHYVHRLDDTVDMDIAAYSERCLDLYYRHADSEQKEADNCVAEPQLSYGLFKEFLDIPFPAPRNTEFTFIDLFAGMGGFRLAMQAHGGKCVFSSEWNKFAQRTYFANFGEVPFGDITKEYVKGYIPEKFDVLCAGFPCQPFSIAGVSKKNSLGRETGFKDKAQGTLFFDVAEIISRHRPKAFFLENVKNLVSHDKGNTFAVIKGTLEELNYTLHYLVMDGQDYVPQHRERIIMVGFDKSVFHGQEDFQFPPVGRGDHSMTEILESAVDDKYVLSDKLWSYLKNYADKHKAKGNGFGFGLVDIKGISRTLSARYYKDGSEILIPRGEGMNPRRLTPRECARLMGYPDEYRLDQVSDVQAYRQCGNSVVVPLITAVAEQIIKVLKKNEQSA